MSLWSAITVTFWSPAALLFVLIFSWFRTQAGKGVLFIDSFYPAKGLSSGRKSCLSCILDSLMELLRALVQPSARCCENRSINDWQIFIKLPIQSWKAVILAQCVLLLPKCLIALSGVWMLQSAGTCRILSSPPFAQSGHASLRI